MVDCILVARYLEVDNDRFIVLGGDLKGDSVEQAVYAVCLIFFLDYLDVLGDYHVRVKIADP